MTISTTTKTNELLPKQNLTNLIIGLDIKNQQDIEQNYVYISPRGQVFSGIEGFWRWCEKQNLDLNKTLEEYRNINKPYQKLRDNNFNNGLIDSANKVKSVFGEDLQMDEMYFCEFYKIPRFGKTRVGQLLLHSKQTQNAKYIQLICDEFASKILDFAKDFDCICFAPPSTPRAIQFMNVLDKTINSDKPRIKTWKEFGDIAIQQKTLKSRVDRVENARETIFLSSEQKFESCLIIDDAIGSGSTLNEIARKLKTQNIISGKIVGIGIVGNLDGYEVINEV